MLSTANQYRYRCYFLTNVPSSIPTIRFSRISLSISWLLLENQVSNSGNLNLIYGRLQFSGTEDFFAHTHPFVRFHAAKTLFLLFHTPFADFAIETFYLLEGSRSYLNRHDGPRTDELTSPALNAQKQTKNLTASSFLFLKLIYVNFKR